MIRVAVLGASGFIGSRIVEMLHLGGPADVRPIVRAASRLARAARFDLDWRVADARDGTALAAAFAGCDVVVHAIGGHRDAILGTLAPVQRAARTAGVRRLVYLSTASVHGQAPEAGTDERSELRPGHAVRYNDWKIAAERALHGVRREGGAELVLLRPGIVYGPRSRWTAGFADDLVAGRAYVVGGGAGVFNGVYVDNLVYAVQLAATAAGVDGEAFLIGDGESVTWADFYRPIAEALGCDLAAVPSVAYAAPPRDWWHYLTIARESRSGRALLSRAPMRLRSIAYSAAEAMHERGRAPAWDTPVAPAPAATLEMALLHRCRYKLPSTKAAARLGYRPPVSFHEACRRSVGWLAFAGYPVRPGAFDA